MKKIFALSIFSLMLAYAPVLSAATKAVPVKSTASTSAKEASFSGFYAKMEAFRIATGASITTEKADASKEILASSKPKNTATEGKPLDGVQQPIAYTKLFLLSIAGFIFGIAAVFYGLCILLAFLILRFLYRKIRNR